jgi:transcriptional regulator with XRE-family HTH domain
MNERLNSFLQIEQLTPARFADLMGIQRSGVSHLLSGRNKPGFDFFEKFLQKFPSVNIEWLISGRGKMYKDMSTPPLFPEQAPPPAEPKDIYTYDSGGIVEPAAPEETSIPLPASPSLENKRIEKVVVLYDDGTFSDYVKP